jgi:hypothetical protein
MGMETVSKFDLSEPDSARLVVNTAVMARPNVPGLRVATARREGVAGIYIWIPGYVWVDGQIIAAPPQEPAAVEAEAVAEE